MEPFFSITFSLFLLMDPIGNIPIFVSLLKKLPIKRQLIVITRELIIAWVVIILFAFLGEGLLKLLHVTKETISISGGIILFIIALHMIFPSEHDGFSENNEKGEPLIVPLAIPLTAGPSVLAAVMIYVFSETHGRLIGAISIAWFASLLVLLSSSFLKKILKDRGIMALQRLMGLILTLLAVQMFLEGLSPLLKH